jgi:hypothetical protein
MSASVDKKPAFRIRLQPAMAFERLVKPVKFFAICHACMDTVICKKAKLFNQTFGNNLQKHMPIRLTLLYTILYYPMA